MHKRRGVEREYSCNICAEVFRNIFSLHAHQRDVHQVGAVNGREQILQRFEQKEQEEAKESEHSQL